MFNYRLLERESERLGLTRASNVQQLLKKKTKQKIDKLSK